MKPTYLQVREHFPRSETREVLYNSLGWNDLVNHPAYWDTCAIRMSYALVRANVILPGAPMRVMAGEAKGRFIEHRQANLSRALTKIWGAPEIYKSKDAAITGIGMRNGVGSFFRIEGGNGGHIDLVTVAEGGAVGCVRSCYFTAVTIWFWPLT